MERGLSPNAACVVTLVARLIHRAEVIEIEAESYLLKEAKELSAETRRGGMTSSTAGVAVAPAGAP